ncbi:MAG: hypothetical protein FJ098_13750, partial [Deltaproteobacteria bacterium]|nr:hypothetical protein [Deltaproteobacteria bacterium]
MQVRFEPLAEQVRKAFVEFTAEEVRAVTDREAVELAKTVRIPGGYVKLKAKLARVKQLPALREQIRFRALESLVQKAAEEGLRLLPFETIGRPEVEHLPELRSLDGGVTVELLVEEKPRPETLRYD